MIQFPLSMDEWYACRDDRTKRVDSCSGFEDFSLGVVIDPRMESVYAIQAMAVITLNILSRWCRTIKVLMPVDTISRLPSWEGQNLKDVLEKIMFDADPYGQFTFGNVTEKDIDQVLIIGKTNETFQKPHIWINGSGWIAGVGYNSSNIPFSKYEDDNPVGPAFASCLGVAEIFRQACGLSVPSPYSIWYSLYDFEKTTDNPNQLKNPKYTTDYNFGRIHQVGCGAVASSLDFLLSLTKWEAEIDLIDYDKVDCTNCNRSLSFSAYDAISNKKKIDICADVLRNSRILPIIFEGSYTDFIKAGKFLDTPPDLILCLANERNVWADIQHNYPPIVLHATTTQSWGVNFGRHIPQKEWCILCRFSKEIEHKFTPSCGEVEIIPQKEQEIPQMGVLPFLSPASAVLVLAEMAKIPFTDYPINNNFILFSFKSAGNAFLHYQRRRELGCICIDQILEIYPDKIKRSKFWKLNSVQNVFNYIIIKK